MQCLPHWRCRLFDSSPYNMSRVHPLIVSFRLVLHGVLRRGEISLVDVHLPLPPPCRVLKGSQTVSDPPSTNPLHAFFKPSLSPFLLETSFFRTKQHLGLLLSSFSPFQSCFKKTSVPLLYFVRCVLAMLTPLSSPWDHKTISPRFTPGPFQFPQYAWGHISPTTSVQCPMTRKLPPLAPLMSTKSLPTLHGMMKLPPQLQKRGIAPVDHIEPDKERADSQDPCPVLLDMLKLSPVPPPPTFGWATLRSSRPRPPFGSDLWCLVLVSPLKVTQPHPWPTLSPSTSLCCKLSPIEDSRSACHPGSFQPFFFFLSLSFPSLSYLLLRFSETRALSEASPASVTILKTPPLRFHTPPFGLFQKPQCSLFFIECFRPAT